MAGYEDDRSLDWDSAIGASHILDQKRPCEVGGFGIFVEKVIVLQRMQLEYRSLAKS